MSDQTRRDLAEAIAAHVADELDGADLLAQAAKEARDAAFTELEWTAERIISGDLPHDNGNVPDSVLDFTDEERAALADKAHAEGEVARAATQWADARTEAAAAKARLVCAAQAAVQMGVPVAAVARAADTSRTRVYEWLNTR